MNFEDLDRQFDESAQRLTAKKSATSQPYSADPLAADHLMLQKSWVYFRERIKSIEDQWQQILASKDDQVRLLKEKIQVLEGRIGELEEEVKAQEIFDEHVVRLRLADHQEFAENARKLKVQWEEERESFERTIHRLEDGLTAAREDSEARLEAQKEGRQEQSWTIEDLRAKLDQQSRRQMEIQNEWTTNAQRQAEEIESLKIKFDLIRQERDRLANLVKESEASNQGLVKTLDDRIQEIRRLEEGIRERDLNQSILKERIEILQREKAALQNMWDQEKAEWRELWDRARTPRDPT